MDGIDGLGYEAQAFGTTFGSNGSRGSYGYLENPRASDLSLPKNKQRGFSCEGTLVEGNLLRHGRSWISAKRGGVDETCSYIVVCRNGRLGACRARSCRGRRAEIRNRH